MQKRVTIKISSDKTSPRGARLEGRPNIYGMQKPENAVYIPDTKVTTKPLSEIKHNADCNTECIEHTYKNK